MRTADSVSPSLTATDVKISLALYVIVYLLMFPTGIAFMAGIMRRGIEAPGLEAAEIESGLPHQPFESAVGPTPES